MTPEEKKSESYYMKLSYMKGTREYSNRKISEAAKELRYKLFRGLEPYFECVLMVLYKLLGDD